MTVGPPHPIMKVISRRASTLYSKGVGAEEALKQAARRSCEDIGFEVDFDDEFYGKTEGLMREFGVNGAMTKAKLWATITRPGSDVPINYDDMEAPSISFTLGDPYTS